MRYAIANNQTKYRKKRRQSEVINHAYEALTKGIDLEVSPDEWEEDTIPFISSTVIGVGPCLEEL